MAATSCGSDLLRRLPAVRGRYSVDADLSRITWFRVGGPAEVSFRPKDLGDLVTFLRTKPQDLPVTMIGVGSNVLIRDGGIEGVVIRLGREFAGIEMVAGAPRIDVARPRWMRTSRKWRALQELVALSSSPAFLVPLAVPCA